MEERRTPWAHVVKWRLTGEMEASGTLGAQRAQKVQPVPAGVPSVEPTGGRTRRSMARATENSEASVKAKRGGAVGEGEGEGTGMRRQKEKGPRAMLPSRRRAQPAGRLASYKARKARDATTAEAARWACGWQVTSAQSRSCRMLGLSASSSRATAGAWPSGAVAGDKRPSVKREWMVGKSELGGRREAWSWWALTSV